MNDTHDNLSQLPEDLAAIERRLRATRPDVEPPARLRFAVHAAARRGVWATRWRFAAGVAAAVVLMANLAMSVNRATVDGVSASAMTMTTATGDYEQRVTAIERLGVTDDADAARAMALTLWGGSQLPRLPQLEGRSVDGLRASVD